MTMGATRSSPSPRRAPRLKACWPRSSWGNQQADKAEGRATAGETFKAVAGRFLDRQENRLRESSYYATRLLMGHAPEAPHVLKFEKIRPRPDSIALRNHADNSGAVSADRARAALSALFTWAMKEGLCESNPVIATNTFSKSGSRERVLSDQELAAVWLALPDNDYGHTVKLLALTGARREEIAGLRWSEVDLESRMLDLPGARTKNKRPFVIPLSETAHDILASIPGVPGAI